MDDDIAAIYQYPVAARQTFYPDTHAQCLQARRHMFGDGRNMPLRTPARDDNIVGDQRLAMQVDGGGINCLIFVKRLEDQLQRLLVVGLCRPADARYLRTSNRRRVTSRI